MKNETHFKQFLRELTKLDALETYHQRISRSDNPSKKRTDVRYFSTKVLNDLKDERDILLIAVKIK